MSATFASAAIFHILKKCGLSFFISHNFLSSHHEKRLMSSGLVSLWFVHQQQHQKKNRVYLEKKEGGSFFGWRRRRRQTARAFLLWSSKRERITKYIRSVATGGAPSLPSTGSVFALLLGLLFYNFGLSATTCARPAILYTTAGES